LSGCVEEAIRLPPLNSTFLDDLIVIVLVELAAEVMFAAESMTTFPTLELLECALSVTFRAASWFCTVVTDTFEFEPVASQTPVVAIKAPFVSEEPETIVRVSAYW
jgi:hypothetical protein